MVDVLSKNLYNLKIRSQALHGGLTQNRRKEAIDLFHANKVDILVASDVAARGLDIKNVELIINYDIPKNSKESTRYKQEVARKRFRARIYGVGRSKPWENQCHHRLQ